MESAKELKRRPSHPEGEQVEAKIAQELVD